MSGLPRGLSCKSGADWHPLETDLPKHAVGRVGIGPLYAFLPGQRDVLPGQRVDTGSSRTDLPVELRVEGFSHKFTELVGRFLASTGR